MIGVVVVELTVEVNGESLIDTGVAPADCASFRGDAGFDLLD